MLFLVGLVGFVIGYWIGLKILLILLRDIPRDQLINNRKLWWKYGPIVWVCGFAGLAIGYYGYLYYLYYMSQ